MLTHHLPRNCLFLHVDSHGFSAKNVCFFRLLSDVSDMGWGVPMYDSDETAPRSPRSSIDIDRAASRRSSIDEGRAPSRKSLDLKYLRDNVNDDPPLR